MCFYSVDVDCIEDSVNFISPIELITEEPLSIRVEGKPYVVVMRTPGKEKEHTAGFCLSEGIIESLDDIGTIGFCNDLKNNVATITLSKSRRPKILGILKRKNYVSNTSCGICGKQIISDMISSMSPIKNSILFEANAILENILSLNKHQPIREKTRAAHCSIIYDKNSEILSSSEDIGRHNALDKSIGEILLKGTIKNASIVVMSSRISYELVQKAARARIPILAAISRPTYLAVNLARKLNMTIISLSKNNGLFIYCNAHHIV